MDTSALVAVAKNEQHYEAIREALLTETGVLPTPVIVEYERVMSLPGNLPNEEANIILQAALAGDIELRVLDADSAWAAVEANARYGSGCGHPAKLNMLDLMIYGMAKTLDLPILCTGKDFATTDALIHPASRTE